MQFLVWFFFFDILQCQDWWLHAQACAWWLFWGWWCRCSAAPSHIETSQLLQSIKKEHCFEKILPRQPVLEKRHFSWRLVALLFSLLPVYFRFVWMFLYVHIFFMVWDATKLGVKSQRVRCICHSSLVAGRTCSSDRPTVWPHFCNGVAGRQLGDHAVWWRRLHVWSFCKANSNFGWKLFKALLAGCPLAAQSLENSSKVAPSPSSNFGCCNAKIPSQPFQGQYLDGRRLDEEGHACDPKDTSQNLSFNDFTKIPDVFAAKI